MKNAETGKISGKVKVACSSDGRCNLFSNTDTVLGKMKRETTGKLAECWYTVFHIHRYRISYSECSYQI